jgi:hypothetical protein
VSIETRFLGGHKTPAKVKCILESNPHPFSSCRGLNIQMRIRIECGLDSRSRAGVWPKDRAGVRAVRTLQGGKNGVRIRFENIRYFFNIYNSQIRNKDFVTRTCVAHGLSSLRTQIYVF